MTTFDRFDPFEQRITAAIDEIAAPRRPDYLDDILRQTARTSQRPRWSFPRRWLRTDVPPTRLGPAAHLPILVAVAALLALLGIALAVGARPPETLPRVYRGEFVTGPAVDAHWPLETILGLRDGSVLLLGDGSTGTNQGSLVLSLTTGVARALGPLTVVRSKAVPIELLDGRVLVLGGDISITPTSDGGTASVSLPSTAEILDPVTGRSTMLGPLRTSRVGFGAVRLADGKVLIAGGQSLDMTSLRDAEIFDPATGTFTPTGPMVDPHPYPVLTLLPDGRVASRDRETIQVFDPATGAFTRTPVTLNDGNLLVSLHGGKVMAVDDHCTEIPRNWLDWLGGKEKQGTLAPDPNQDPVGVSAVDPVTGTVQRLQDLPHCASTAIALPNGQVFVTGWWSGSILRDRHTYPWSGIYDPSTGVTRQTAEPIGGRYTPFVPLADGQVLTIVGSGPDDTIIKVFQ